MSLLVILAAAVFAGNEDYCFGGAKPHEPIHVPSVPVGHDLKLVMVVTRHGARTPLRAFPKMTPTWNCTENELAVLSTSRDDTENVRILFRKMAKPESQSLPGNCFLGQLTTLGALQHASIGKGFYNAFVRAYPLLSPKLNPRQIYMRSTEIARTQQSAQSQVLNIFPDALKQQDQAVLPVLQLEVVESPNDHLLPNRLCPYFEQLMNDVFKSQRWKDAVAAIPDVIAALEKTYGVTINVSSKQLEDFADSMHAMECHGLDFPASLPPASRQALYRAVDQLWATRYESPLLSSLSLGALSRELLEEFLAPQPPNRPVFRLYSAHDTTLAPLLALLGIYDGVWPPLASQLVLQLVANRTSKVEAVRVSYNGNLVVLPQCGGAEPCPKQTFERIVQQIMTNFVRDSAQWC